MRRMWPEEFSALLDHAEEVNLSIPPAEGGGAKEPTTRKALKARITQDDFEKIWPLAEPPSAAQLVEVCSSPVTHRIRR